MLTGLSDFLRLSLHNAGEEEVPIEREIQLLERYVMIQQLRFQDRLKISIAIDPAANRALVPNLLLQPLAIAVIVLTMTPARTIQTRPMTPFVIRFTAGFTQSGSHSRISIRLAKSSWTS